MSLVQCIDALSYCTLVYFLYIVIYCRHIGFLVVLQFQAYHSCLAVRNLDIFQAVP